MPRGKNTKIRPAEDIESGRDDEDDESLKANSSSCSCKCCPSCLLKCWRRADECSTQFQKNNPKSSRRVEMIYTALIAIIFYLDIATDIATIHSIRRYSDRDPILHTLFWLMIFAVVLPFIFAFRSVFKFWWKTKPFDYMPQGWKKIMSEIVFLTFGSLITDIAMICRVALAEKVSDNRWKIFLFSYSTT